MTSAQHDLSEIRAAYEEAFGPYNHVVEFRRDKSDEEVPSAMNVLFFLPVEGGDDVTLVATAGMSSRVMKGSHEHIEMAVELKGSVNAGERERIAKQLAELAVLPYRERRYFAPGMILENFVLYPFERMQWAVVAEWNFLAPEFLPVLLPAVRLLRLVPLHESEVAFVEEKGVKVAQGSLRDRGAIFEDYDRDAAV